MINSGGENISPAEIESVLSLHPAVAEVAVAGLPDERWGQRVAAFVRRGGTVDRAALDAWCRQSRLADYKRPRDYVFVVEIPKSPVGKILRRMLVAGSIGWSDEHDRAGNARPARRLGHFPPRPIGVRDGRGRPSVNQTSVGADRGGDYPLPSTFPGAAQRARLRASRSPAISWLIVSLVSV
jgi:AMP-binding enzyme C-terminal domain